MRTCIECSVSLFLRISVQRSDVECKDTYIHTHIYIHIHTYICMYVCKVFPRGVARLPCKKKVSLKNYFFFFNNIYEQVFGQVVSLDVTSFVQLTAGNRCGYI